MKPVTSRLVGQSRINSLRPLYVIVGGMLAEPKLMTPDIYTEGLTKIYSRIPTNQLRRAISHEKIS